jgi:hypothetical protein
MISYDTVEKSKKQIPKVSIVAPAQSDPEPITSGRVDVLTLLRQFLKSDEVNSKEADLPRRLENELQKREAHSDRGHAEVKSKPIKFKDVVGRKSTFLVDLCKTWALSLITDLLLDLSHDGLIRALCREWKNLSVRPFCMFKSSDCMSLKVTTIFFGQMARYSFPRYDRQLSSRLGHQYEHVAIARGNERASAASTTETR